MRFLKIPKNQSGFSIIESLIAILVLTIALIPLLSVATSSLDIASQIRNNLIAANLAQEGLEVSRFIRDRNQLIGAPFNDGMIGTWRVDWNSLAFLPLGINPPLIINSNGLYNYSSGNLTIFKRTITVQDGNPGDPNKDLKVIVEVTWPAKNNRTMPGCPTGTRCVRAESHLFNWN